MKREKVYSVEFMNYTNCLRDTVSTEPEKDENGVINFMGIEYLDVKDGFLVRESELDKYRVFGGGYNSIHFVGYMDFYENHVLTQKMAE